MLKLLEYIIKKGMSGRLLITVACCIAFVYMVIAGTIETKDALQVIMVAMTFYFTRTRNGE